VTKKIIAATAALILGIATLTACGSSGGGGAQEKGQDQTELAFEQQSAAVPYPATELRDSLERRNLKERLIRTNKPDALGYVYLMSFGKIIGYYTIKGKVSSTQSQMTTDNLIIDRYEGDVVVSAPGDDGSYGLNEPGIFFFTTEGQMVTTSLDYIWSDNPIEVDVPRLG
jgi:hypothetical protein